MSGGLRILAGPPPEYNSPSLTAISEVTPNVMTIQTGHSSPSTPSIALEGGPSSSTDSLDDHRRSKKVDAPLPQIPQLVVAEGNPLNDQGEDEIDESPYDYAKFDREGQHEGRAEDVQDVNKSIKLPGSYAKVSRHSESNQDIANYAEVRQFNSFESRGRSATDPVEPSLPSSPFHSRTFTAVEGATHLPLPLPPRDYKQEEDKDDDTYDSIEDLRAAAEAKLKTKNSLDDENEEMYESVPEDFKEELGILSAPAPLLPLRNIELASNTASSPTKVPNLASPDSPTAKLFKKSTKESKRKNRAETASSEDEHKHRMFLFNRFRSASASAGIRKDNKKDHEMLSSSPDHNLPLPPIPHAAYFPHSNEDNENGAYDTVQNKVGKTLSLPPSVRMSAFSSRVNEPLPEVPEDSGSGGTTFVVKRDRLIEAIDPNYDTVNSALLGSPVEVQDDSEFDPDYDTVKHKPQNSPPLPHSGRGYATVNSHDLPIEDPVKHDDMGYALLDQEIVQHKRAASLKKSSVDNPGEPPYDRVQQEENDAKPLDDPGYASVKQVLGTLSESENVPSPEDSVQNGQEPKPSHGYAKVTSHSSMEDDKDPYATIDPEIIERKRTESLSKSSTQPQEPPYDRVKDLKPSTELLPNEPVDVSNSHQTEPLTVSEPESDEASLQHQGDDDIVGQVEIKIEDHVSDDEEDKYTRVDLLKKHQNKKKAKEMTEDPLDVRENIPPSSPVPPLPPIGDLGDISEFDPPPVPTQTLDVHDDNTSELSHNEDEMADAEPQYSKVMLTSKTQGIPPTNGECKIIKVIPHNRGKMISSQEQIPTQELTQNSIIPSVCRSLHSSTSSEGVPVYDSLESQQPMYDSLDPVKGGPVYDSLEAVPGKGDNSNHVDNLNVNV